MRSCCVNICTNFLYKRRSFSETSLIRTICIPSKYHPLIGIPFIEFCILTERQSSRSLVIGDISRRSVSQKSLFSTTSPVRPCIFSCNVATDSRVMAYRNRGIAPGTFIRKFSRAHCISFKSGIAPEAFSIVYISFPRARTLSGLLSKRSKTLDAKLEFISHFI